VHRAKLRLAILCIITTLAATEVFFRNFQLQQTVYSAPPRSAFYKEGDYFSWRLLERSRGAFTDGLLHVNSLGYRGAEFSAGKAALTARMRIAASPPAMPRILIICT
jgi:hypothetical protein